MASTLCRFCIWFRWLEEHGVLLVSPLTIFVILLWRAPDNLFVAFRYDFESTACLQTLCRFIFREAMAYTRRPGRRKSGRKCMKRRGASAFTHYGARYRYHSRCA